jgi:predicted unusual protein kinase regulating ubiquinone biosynthesis (AarF/ABC1/UbiB family)
VSRDEEVPASGLRRARVVGRAGLRVGTQHLVHGLRRMVPGHDAPAARAARDEEVARIVFDALSQLRGTALKAAQLLCMEIDLLPEPMRKQLGHSFYQVPPLSPAMSRSLIHAQLDALPEHLFARFEPAAFAAASLGQVHRATSRDGEPLAIKLQYPGVATSLASDMRMIRGLIKVLPIDHVVRPQVVSRTLRDIEDRLGEEIDYEREAEHTQWFARAFADQPHVRIPRVYPQFSTPVVLCTERLTGHHLADWLADARPSQDDRDRAGQRLVDFFYHCIYRLHRVHADPNPGNFLFLDDGALGVLDFGCVQAFAPAFVRDMRASIQGYLDGDLDAALAAYQRMGLVTTDSDPAARRARLAHARDHVARIFGSDRFDFAAHAGAVSESQRAFADSLGTVENVPRGLAYYNRAFSGMMRLLEQLGARVCLRPPPVSPATSPEPSE